MSKQFVECKLRGCTKSSCPNCCCDDDQVQEWMDEYFTFHDKSKDYWKSLGIKIEFDGDRINFKNCSDGKNCKFLKFSPNKDIDPRPIDCKIYPYTVDWGTMDFDKKIAKLYLWDSGCPVVKSKKIPEKFKKEVEDIIKRDFAVLFHGARFSVKFVNRVHR